MDEPNLLNPLNPNLNQATKVALQTLLPRREIRPQPGFQEKFLSSSADIVIGGGAAGAGKTFSLLLDIVRYLPIRDFGAVIFRRTTPQIRNQGGLWDTSFELYPWIGGVPKETTLEWNFSDISAVKMNHLEYEKNVQDHQGAQYAFIGFDELTHFTRRQFFYLLTRNRSLCGVKPCIRATCNPDPDSWVADFISWWIDEDTGFPIPERDGVIRYFTVDEELVIWADTPEEVIEKCPHIFAGIPEEIDPVSMVKSATFIFGNIYGNKLLMKKNPQYLSNLLSQNPADKAQLLEGNWKLKQDDLAICDYLKVNDLFTNFTTEYEQLENGDFKLDEEGKKIPKKVRKAITTDVARFGRNLTVVLGWEGFKVKRIIVLTKSKTTEVVDAIEAMREIMQCGKSDVLVDQDGVGGGVVDQGGYIGFSGGASVVEDPTTRIKENYANLKTQCYYRFAEQKINEGLVAISLENVLVDGQKTTSVRIGKEVFDIEKLIKLELRAFKREGMDQEGKKQLNSKDQQKNLLNGRSPDFGDAIMLREFFELKPKKQFSFTSLA